MDRENLHLLSPCNALRACRVGIEVVGLIVDWEILVRFLVYPHQVWAGPSDSKEIKDLFGCPGACVKVGLACKIPLAAIFYSIYNFNLNIEFILWIAPIMHYVCPCRWVWLLMILKLYRKKLHSGEWLCRLVGKTLFHTQIICSFDICESQHDIYNKLP